MHPIPRISTISTCGGEHLIRELDISEFTANTYISSALAFFFLMTKIMLSVPTPTRAA